MKELAFNPPRIPKELRWKQFEVVHWRELQAVCQESQRIREEWR